MTSQQKFVIKCRKDQSYQELVLANHNFHAYTVEPMSRLQNSFLGKKENRNQKAKTLKDIVFQNKVKLITKNFIRKLRRNTVNRKPLEGLQDHENTSIYFWGKIQSTLKVITMKQGIALENWSLAFWNVINILQTVMVVFVFSMMITFSEVETYLFFNYIRILSCIFYSIDILLNFTSQRYQNGKKLQFLGQISNHYLKNGFTIDIITAVIFPLSFIVTNAPISSILTLISIMKLVSSLRKFEKIQYLVIGSRQKQHYYGLIKVFLTNFIIGHFLSVLLNLMPAFDTDQNWHIKMGILNQVWYIKYIWGYYWGTNIMLTVGFGDITATNCTQAIMLVFIETFSCITLAYNISNVGALISSIRQNQQSKKRKLKTFHRMCKENDVCSAVSSKISNFIEQAYQIKQTFEHDARDEVMEFLPKHIQTQYRKQANKILFDGLGFLNNLSKKSLLTLAQQVNRKICHPQEIIVRKESICDFYIIQKGTIGFTCRIRSNLDGKIIEQLAVEGNSKPKIISLDFIKNKAINYNIKSINYSILCFLSRQSFMESLKCSQMDYQLFCVLKDKDQCIIDQNNLYQCPNCKKQYHNKFQCTRLHYIPLKFNVVRKHLENAVEDCQVRIPFQRSKIQLNPYLITSDIFQEQQRFILQNYDPDHYREIQQLINFYQDKNTNMTNMASDQIKQNTKTLHTSQKFKFSENKMRREMFTGHYQFKIEEKAIHKLQELIEGNKKQKTFWELQSDLAYDFKYYFKDGNPEYLNKLKRRKYKSNVNSIQRSVMKQSL